MANIKKSFNFRNGVQVDDDNLKVSATGLVGIGTTVPTEALDVRGNLVVSGVSSAVTVQAGVLTVTTLNPTEIIGAGVSIKSGIVTASSGIITYFGDGINLLNLPTSQWVDTIVGLGVSSIYNAGGNVGIATTAALFTLQIGNDVNSSGQKGVGISSFGDVKASGIITASTFSGNVAGNVTGNITGNVTGNLNSLGVSTAADLRVTDLNVDGHTNLDNVNIVGLTTFVNPSGTAGLRARSFTAATFAVGELRVLESPDQSIVDGGPMIQFYTNKTPAPLNGPGDREEISFYTSLQSGAFLQDGSFQLYKNFNVAGLSTFTGDVIVGSATTLSSDGIVVGNNKDLKIGAGLTIGANTDGSHVTFFNNTEVQHILEPNVTSEVWISEIQVSGTTVFVPQFKINRNTGVELYYENGGRKFATSGIGATVYGQLDTTNIVASGVITATTELNSPLIGVGTASPAHDIQVRKSGNAEIQVTSDTGIAGITVGREPAGLKTNNAEVRYGGGTGAPYSTSQSLDLVNYGTDNFNYYLSANNPNSAVGDFHWHKGLNSSRLMTLTKGGNLGIGETQPQERLTVAGVCTVTSNSFVGANLNVSGNSTIGGNLTVNGTFNVASINTNIIGNVTGNLTGLVNATSGVSTFFKVGINTDLALPTAQLDVSEGNAIFKNVGIGSTEPDGILDVSGALSQASKKFILLPKVSAGGTSVLQSDSVEGGALIYNTTLRKLQFYNGSNWETVTSVEVTG